MRIARVFPTKTSMSPTDQDAYFDYPGLFVPQYDEIHISVSFTWDIKKAEWLKKQWERIAPVKIGGPAIDGEPTNGFIPGVHLRKGVVITSRGCPNNCPWCFVNKPLKELEIREGNNILDNNLLACSKDHLGQVFQMLRGQKEIKFTGGLEASSITDKIAEQIRGLRLIRLYLAYDDSSRFKPVKKAYQILIKYFSRESLGCYVLIGFNGDTMDKAESRLRQIWDLGGMPFAMLYRNKEGEYPKPEKEWRRFQRSWCRPAAIRATMKGKK